MKNVVYLTAPDWIEKNDGFYPPTKQTDKEIPVIEEDEEIDTRDIPL